ncbi:glucose-methanol-choline oxidoreductase [Chaetomium strumarium]|uniref:Glucose-methanol-choline oxidoreductase n=1 Tax=Chaetomium strumarium TaxID=1170767 RepID=A0AAJ0GUT4_9PEZI|nr:glucose-methanol-choline oxidoreductase [Chaetomium strumarium]
MVLLGRTTGALFALCSALSSASPVYHEKRQDTGSYDFVIVGGGTAGLALAARLTEDEKTTALVLEAGGPPDQVAAYKAPGADLQVLGSPIDWGFTTLPQEGLNGRQLTYNRGRCLGGSSAINGLTYGRGSSGLYDLWETLGNAGWGWDGVLPFFKKSTTFVPPQQRVAQQDFDASLYGQGPVKLSYPPYVNGTPGSIAFVESLSAIQVPIVQELNAGCNVGAKQEPLTMDDKYHRSSSYDNYYMEAKERPNLRVLPFSPVQQLILEEGAGKLKATGVVYLDYLGGRTLNVTVNKEVIMSAGSIQTPQLLMLSGIGPTETLNKAGIKVYLANENVGQNLQDHTYFSINVEVGPSISVSSLYHDLSKLQKAEQEFQDSKGPLTAPVGLSYGFEKIPADVLTSINATTLASERPNQAHIEYYYETIYYPNVPSPYYRSHEYNTSYISLTAGLVAPLSRGSVSIRSNSLSDAPEIDLKYYVHPEDQAVAIYAFRNLRKILTKFATYNDTVGPNHGEVNPGPAVQTDEQILDYIRETAVTVWHASGTCAMLPREKGGVVDERLRVYGVEGLRVVDASVFPVIPDQHTQGPVYMVAEKAAVLIKEDWGL